MFCEVRVTERVILHCDCNCFFASVEAVLNPELNNYAFAVCGDPEYRHGIVLAKNEKAKKYGVLTGEPIWKAKLKCPSLKTVLPTYGMYKKFSKRIFDIYCGYTDLVEPFGIDECWLDVSGTTHLFGSGEKIANELRRRIKKEVGVTISAGVSFNKLFAKMGSDYRKPDATTVITRENFKTLLYPLPIEDFFGVGQKTALKLRGNGIKTIGELAENDVDFLKSFLGKQGAELYGFANGMDYSPVNRFDYREEYKSIGNGMTFKRDLYDFTDIRTCISFLCDKVSARLRKHGFECRTIQVAVRDTKMNTVLKSQTLKSPTNLAFDLIEASFNLVKKYMATGFVPVRALSVTGMNLLKNSEVYYEQISFFELDYYLKREKEQNLEKTRDVIRRKYGTDVVKRCSLIKNEFGI